MNKTTIDMARKALALYYDFPLMVRFHNYVRYKTCPFFRIEPFVPREGKIYDLGCGHGFFQYIWPSTAAHGLSLTSTFWKTR